MNGIGPWIAACEREPIHMPGAIQPWGALIIAGAEDLIVRHASANLAGLLGQHAQNPIGQSLHALLPPDQLAALLPGAVQAAAHAAPAPPAAALHLASHRLGDALYIELEPASPPGAAGGWGDAKAVVESLRAAGSSAELFESAVSELRRATFYDRVMLYRFDPAGHGAVLAEACAADQEPYLGLHYPASDVPRQARRLYLRQRVRVIGDVLAPPVPLLGADIYVPAAFADLSLCALRAASPIHIEYLRAMGARATLVVSLTVDGGLWGMLVCHHRAPRLPPPDVRGLCDLIGQVTSLMIATLRDSENRAEASWQKARVAALASRLAARPGGAPALAQALADCGAELMALCAAEGAVIRLGGACHRIGQAPPEAEAAQWLDALLAAAPEGGVPLVTDNAGTTLAAHGLADPGACFAGMLLLPLIHAPGDAILWLRPEQAKLVRWGGDPEENIRRAEMGALTPRHSFAVWQQHVRGQSLPWGAAQVDAACALRREIDRLLVRHAEGELSRLRHHDPLTGLPNRRLLRERLDLWVRARPSSCLLAIELDRFTEVNDTLGEAAGDALLLQAGSRLSRVAAGPGMMVARAGGDEFAIFCDSLTEPQAAALAESARAALADPFEVAGQSIRVTASVGIARVGIDLQDLAAEDLMSCAALALRAARQQGGNSICFFTGKLREGAERRMDLEQELRAALNLDHTRAGAFHLLFQPCVALCAAPAPAAADRAPTWQLRGFEALLRWQHPRLGAIAPAEFIPVAEECGLIGKLGDWVLRAALDTLTEWRGLAAGLPQSAWRLAVNVSPLQLTRPGFAAELQALLAARDLPPACLTVEVTEGVFADEAATAVVADMRGAGVRIAVDDFGVGYSTLSCLRRMPADELKLDRSFLQRADGGPSHEKFIAALVQLARAVGMSVLAEGVETEAHLAAVAAAGCNAAQGWLFAPALAADQAAEWIANATGTHAGTPPRLPQPFSFRDIMEATNDAIVVTSAQLEAPGPRIVYVNPAFARLTGWRLADVLGRTPRMLQGEKTDRATLDTLRASLQAGQPAQVKLINYNRAGMAYWVELRIMPLRNQAGEISHFVAIERDITQDIQRLGALEEAAERDPLTNLANRRGLERFSGTLAATPAAPLCVAYIDIDNFKQINDTHGHAVGDALLLGIADIMSENMRRVDFIGRMGGDEFLICMPAILPADAMMVAERLHRIIASTAFPTQAGPLRSNCSIGLAAMRAGDCNLDAAIERADAALYAAKQGGRGRVVLASVGD